MPLYSAQVQEKTGTIYMNSFEHASNNARNSMFSCTKLSKVRTSKNIFLKLLLGFILFVILCTIFQTIYLIAAKCCVRILHANKTVLNLNVADALKSYELREKSFMLRSIVARCMRIFLVLWGTQAYLLLQI